MAEYDEAGRRLTIKIVYYGPALGGKTTNLRQLRALLRPELAGTLMTLETRDDRTLFFDLWPFGFSTPSGLLVKLKLFTVPGQVAHDGTRKAVLARADGVVFVADSRRQRTQQNIASFENMLNNAGRQGLDFDTLPLVIQLNKRDLPDVLSEEEIRAYVPAARWPQVMSVAERGAGVCETLRELLQRLYPRLDSRYALGTRHGLTSEQFLAAVLDGVSGSRAAG